MSKWIKPDKVAAKVAEKAKAAGKTTSDYVKERSSDRAANVVMMSVGDSTPDRPAPKSREEKRYGQV